MIKIVFKEEHYDLMRDLGIVALSVFAAILLVKTDLIDGLLTASQQYKIIGSFVAGMFFVSIFTAAPATVVLGEISLTTPIWLVAIFGGLGALLGDVLIFSFLKDKLTKNVITLIKRTGIDRFFSIFHLKMFRWVFGFIGALIVASPLPDELGLAMMGFSKIKTSYFIPMSLILNTVGIMIIGLVARAI